MESQFSYSTTYVLDRPLFSETYDQSVVAKDIKTKYGKSVVLSLFGVVLLYFTEVTAYLAWFFIVLGAIDAVSVRYQKSWWLTRQMMSRAANTKLTLTIDDVGVRSQSHYVDSQIKWSDMTSIEATSKGWLLHIGKGKTYISNSKLNDEAIAFIKKQAATRNE